MSFVNYNNLMLSYDLRLHLSKGSIEISGHEPTTPRSHGNYKLFLVDPKNSRTKVLIVRQLLLILIEYNLTVL